MVLSLGNFSCISNANNDNPPPIYDKPFFLMIYFYITALHNFPYIGRVVHDIDLVAFGWAQEDRHVYCWANLLT